MKPNNHASPRINPNPMSRKRKFYAEYNLSVNGVEYPREYTITGVRTREEAISKLVRLCGNDPTTELIIKSITEM